MFLLSLLPLIFLLALLIYLPLIKINNNYKYQSPIDIIALNDYLRCLYQRDVSVDANVDVNVDITLIVM